MNTRSGPEFIHVWPLWLRLFHWLLVAAFLTSYLTGEDYRSVHVWSGYLIIGLLLLRMVLGVFSSGHASLRSWRCAPRAALVYVSGLWRGNARRYLGHNPAGACMSLALVLILSMTLATGLALHGVHGSGPLTTLMSEQTAAERSTSSRFDEQEHDEDDERAEHASDKSFAEESSSEEFWEELHELSVNIALTLLILHILGVLASSWRHRENLPRAMLDGRKKLNR